MARSLFALLTIICLFIYPVSLHAKHVIRFATLAPDGTAWMNVMKEFNAALKNATDDEVSFKIYPSMSAGDERDVVRKIRFNQMHSAGFTGNGLGIILPEIRILELPFLFHQPDEIDYVYEKMTPYFKEKFEEKGFIFLGWAEVGLVYIMTTQPVRNVQDMKQVKMWTWEGDPLAEQTFREIGISPTPLSITDVLNSLQYGLIDGVYTSPLGAISLQWFTRVKYVFDFPMTNASGAVLISKRIFNRLSAEHQRTLMTMGKKYLRQLTIRSREDNTESLNVMKQAGIQFVTPAPDFEQTIEKIGITVAQKLQGDLYSQETLQNVMQHLMEFRKQHSSQVSQ